MKNNFIGEFNLKNSVVCDQLIFYFKKNKDKQCPGMINKNNTNQVDKDCKTSTDLEINLNFNIEKIIIDYLTELKICFDKYIKKYKFCNYYSSFGIKESAYIQYYEPFKGNFKKWHTERHSKNSDRHLVFMTYLNTINDGGETEFYYQKKLIKPKKGKTVIWPSDWTHTHKGHFSSKEKYIITGWTSFV
jgi:hypothetical protein